MDTQDRRVKRTQNLLAKALIALTLEKGYESVSIRDITERADVGYATFFRHYRDKDALLLDVTDVVLAELVSLLSPEHSQADPSTMGVVLFRYARDHSEVIRALLGSRGSSALIQRIIEAGVQDIMRQQREREDSTVPLEVAAHHLVASSVALIQWWLEHQMPYSPEHMGAIYYQLIFLPTATIAFDS